MMQRMMAVVGVAAWGLAMAGPLWAENGLALTTRVSGVVEEVLVKPGQSVRKGDVLLRLERTVLRARLDEAMAEFARAQADEEDARRDLERAQELYERTVSSTSELDAAKLRRVRAEAGRSAAQARQVVARKNLEDAELRAPRDGVVSAVPGGAGTVVTADCQPRTLVVLNPSRP